MADDRDPVTGLGPDTSGPGGPGWPGGTPRVQVHTWRWGADEARRPGRPWIGVFLLVFGSLLLIQQVFPEARSLGSVAVLAIGIAFLVKWGIDRGSGSLYAGAIITTLAAPGIVEAMGIEAEGLTTFSLGIAFLFIGAVRAAGGGGTGWQLWFGAILALLGGISIATPAAGGLIVPAALVAVGVLIIVREMRRAAR